MRNGSHLDAVEDGCSECEVEQCDGTVGYGGRLILRAPFKYLKATIVYKWLLFFEIFATGGINAKLNNSI